MDKKVKPRAVKGDVGEWSPNTPDIIKRIYANRGVLSEAETSLRLKEIHPAHLLGGMDEAVFLLMEAILNDKVITVSGDYDCDGATGTSVAVRGLRMFGATQVHFIVPDRFKHGYGLSPALVDAMSPQPDMIVTVDSGVSSVEGVAYAKSKGIKVVVTDHHLPGEILPNADAIVNPNLEGDAFPSKALAGVGVMFYLLMAMRGKTRDEDWWPTKDLEPPLQKLLPLVALGTIADLVVLDHNNRCLIRAGMEMMRHGDLPPGLKALADISGKDLTFLSAQDISFGMAPRLNAAGRLENMGLGVEALITDKTDEAVKKVEELDNINQGRRQMQASMLEEAEKIVESMDKEAGDVGIVVYDPTWHPGIVGLVASKLKESLHRPVVAFAPAEKGSSELRGSCRSIEGFHLRDALALMDARYPGLIDKFGGHAMAAGLSMDSSQLEVFRKVFNQVATEAIDEGQLTAVLETDGPLSAGDLSLGMAKRLAMEGPWGQGFPLPIFDNVFDIVSYQVIGQGHVKLLLRDPRTDARFEGMHFFGYEGVALPLKAHVVYELSIHRWREKESLQLLIRYLYETIDSKDVSP